MIKKTHVESLLLLPRGYDLRYCLLTCLLLLREWGRTTPPPHPQAGTAPGDPHCGRKGYAWAAPGFCRSAEKVVTTTPRMPAGSVAPQSPGPHMRRAETGSARRGRGEPSRINAGTGLLLPHTAAVTPEALRSCPGRGGIETPHGGMGAHDEALPPHGGGHTRVSPVLSGPRRDRDAPWGSWGAHGEVPPPQSGGYTRVPPVLPRPRRYRDAPWGFEDTPRVPSPTQRRLHPSPSGPAWAAEG